MVTWQPGMATWRTERWLRGSPGWLRGAVQVLCPLLEKKPWQHTDSAGGMHRFEQGQWVRVGADHQRSMAKCEAQAWLAVYALVGEPEVRRKSRGTPS